MPGRADSFVTGGIYHVFNKTIDEKLIFLKDTTVLEFLECLSYYRVDHPKTSFSLYRRMMDKNILHQAKDESPLVEILVFCIMPRYFHLILQQKAEGGIVRFMSRVGNSFTRSFNKGYRRLGPLFMPNFRSRALLTNSALLYSARHVHLTPLLGGVVTDKERLLSYPWNSLMAYIHDEKQELVHTKTLMHLCNDDALCVARYTLHVQDYFHHADEVAYVKRW